MDSSLGRFILIAGIGLVIFKPRDVPIFARAAGRVVGSTVRTLYKARASIQVEPSPDMTDARKRLMRSARAVDEIATRLRKEVGNLGISPRSFLHRDEPMGSSHPVILRQHEKPSSDRTLKMSSNVSKRRTDDVHDHMSSDTADRLASKSSRDVFRGERKLPGVPRHVSGAEIIADVIEEAAFADQEARILGSKSHGKDL